MKNFLFAFLCALLLVACGIGNTNTRYSRGQIGKRGSTSTGVIVSMDVVEIEGTNTVGSIAGAVAGGAAGSMIGGNTAVNVIAGAGGAVLGGAIGGQAEKLITKDTAFEFLVKQDRTGAVISIVQTNELALRPGDRVILVELDGATRIRQKMYQR